MRILYLNNSFPKVSETFITNEAIDLVRLGVDVRIFSLFHPPPSQLSALGDVPEISGRIFYRPALQKKRSRKLLRVISLLVQNFITCTLIPSLRFALSGTFSFYEGLETATALAKYNAKADIIHCHFGPMGILAHELKRAGLVKGPVTTVFHGYDISTLLSEKPAGYYDALVKSGRLFFPVNLVFRDRLRALGAPDEKIRLYHIGVDSADLKFSPWQGGAVTAPRLVSVGRLVEKKGHRYLIEAVALALKARPGLSLSLDIIGDGPLMTELQAQTDRLGIGEHVVLHGQLQHSAVRDILAASHIFILPSVVAADGDMEGVPVVLSEAMATGLPVIATRHSGIPELIEDGVCGFLVPERDAAALCARILYLIDNQNMWPALTKAARETVETKFNRAKQARFLLNEFNGIVPDAK